MNSPNKINKSQSIDGVFKSDGNKSSKPTFVSNQKTLVHQRVQKSSTLSRSIVIKPVNKNRRLMSEITPNNKNARSSEAVNNKVKKTERKKIFTDFKLNSLDSYSIDDIKFDDIPNYAPPIQNIKSASQIRIEEQLKKADAHLNYSKKAKLKDAKNISRLRKLHPKHKKALGFSFSFASFLIFISMTILLNLPIISLALVNRKVGFKAQLPEYTPSGFSIKSPIGYSNGRVVLKFKSNSSDLSYQIEQKPTKWTTETLKEQITSSNGNQYLTQAISGITIFFTDNNTATWINDGLIYTLKGDSGLSSNQIASIATSIK